MFSYAKQYAESQKQSRASHLLKATIRAEQISKRAKIQPAEFRPNSNYFSK